MDRNIRIEDYRLVSELSIVMDSKFLTEIKVGKMRVLRKWWKDALRIVTSLVFLWESQSRFKIWGKKIEKAQLENISTILSYVLTYLPTHSM